MKRKYFIISLLLWHVLCAVQLKAQDNMNEVLNAKQKSMAIIAANEAKGDIASLKTALSAGLDNGLTVNQIKEVLSQLYAYTGFPRSLNALGTLGEVLNERVASGVMDVEGAESSALPSGFDALKEGTKVQTKLSGKPFDYTFSPAIGYYLKAHLFGDIFARDVLTFKERELATISALSAIDGLHPQLTAHVRGGVNMGLSEAEIEAIASVLKDNVGEQEAYRLRKAIAAYHGEAFEEKAPMNLNFPKGEPNVNYAEYFIGNSYLAPLLGGKLPMSNVTFEPRCRNNWHIHHGARQILICVSGEGWYQEWGKPAQKLHTGDVIDIPAEVKHWHGATKDSWFQHIAVHLDESDSPSNEWLEPVDDQWYDKL